MTKVYEIIVLLFAVLTLIATSLATYQTFVVHDGMIKNHSQVLEVVLKNEQILANSLNTLKVASGVYHTENPVAVGPSGENNSQ